MYPGLETAMARLPLHDRREAGMMLADDLRELRGRNDLIVLGLPRGGIPVAYEVARELEAPLDAYIVRKLGVPGHEELAMGAIATGDVTILNDDIIDELGISQGAIDAVVAQETRELHRRERLYRGAQPPPKVAGRTVILVDDGLATGTTMRAAVRAVRKLNPRSIVVAVPVAAPSTCHSFEGEVDRIVCSQTPEHFSALGMWYEDFGQTTDQEVRDLLAQANGRAGPLRPLHPVADQPAGGSSLAQALARQATPLTDEQTDYDRLLDAIGDARLVLIGEASHGTDEFYRRRAEITRRLIAERGFDAVAAEADWPDAFRVNRYVRDTGDDTSPVEALDDFRRFPQWMWRNTVVRDFIGWLRGHNDAIADPKGRAGFYGLDLYSLNASIGAVIGYLDTVDPEAAARARHRYACFDHFADDVQAYGYAASLGVAEDCEEQVVNQLLELQRRAADLAMRDGQLAEDAFFSAEQNARLVINAETYYRSMFRGRVSSWNLRDSHMADTLDRLLDHLTRRNGAPAKVVVWAHNSHLGDARATQMGAAGEHNLGQLARQRHGGDTFLVGQTTHHGSVTAASDWDARAERMRVRPGLPGSFEALFHDVGVGAFLLPLRDADPRLNERRLERAIGVIYRPETERISHYFEARLLDQFDAILHIDETAALVPLEPTEEWDLGEAPETWPFAGEPIPGRRTA
jgi:erythromycin esterase-like protein/predicted phosphoribosyltransferase